MARQSSTPVQFQRSTRIDKSILMSSGRAGVVVPIMYAPLLRGDSASGSVNLSVELGEMPRPLINGATINAQAWFVPKSIHPQFSGADEFMHSYMGDPIKTLGAADRTPPPFFTTVTDGATLTTLAASDFFKTLGIHITAGEAVNTDTIDAFNLIYNFRLAAHSSKLARRDYASENLANSTALPRALWPSNRFSQVTPDYESSLLVGSLDLDVTAGSLPVSGIDFTGTTSPDNSTWRQHYDLGLPTSTASRANTNSGNVGIALKGTYGNAASTAAVYAQMAGQTVATSLADIDKARTTQAFAKLRSAYAGNDATGFSNDDTIIATLMSGMSVPSDQMHRPILLDSKRVPVGFAERFATDASNLDVSIVQGRTQLSLSVNVPRADMGGTIICTMELLPDRVFEAQTDESLHVVLPSELPDALRDVQRTEPVDFVKSRRLDARHTTPDALYGYEPMNMVWANRDTTRLGGAFHQPTAGSPVTDQRSGIWQTNIVDPSFTDDHYLAPANFPHTVFSDTLAPAFEFVAQHSLSINGLLQVGDVLVEDNSDYAETIETQPATA